MRSQLSGLGAFRVLGWIAAVVLAGPGFLRAAIKKTFEEILATKPAPMLPTDGPLNPQRAQKKPKKTANKKREGRP